MMEHLDELELRIFYLAFNERYHIDLSNYRQAYITRRLNHRMELDHYDSLTLLTNQVIHDPNYALKILNDLSISVTDMYRCPEFYQSISKNIFPIFKTYPTIHIWHAGCATGEEVISLAILLKEANLYERTRIIATDISEKALEVARKGIYPITKIKQWTENYNKAGGLKSFSDYYDVKYNYAIFDKDLFENIEFKVQNLTNKDYPAKQNFILCRNVFIYFSKNLQTEVLTLFHQSLIPEGFLGLGLKESIYANHQFSYVDRKYKLLKKI